jgi:hypothetical protein
MKKALVVLIVLVVLGGAVFYFGWVQIHIPGDSCAVIFTKTGGFARKVTLPGKFTWRWEQLIPTNLTLYRYSLASYRTQVQIRQSWDSAELYSSILPDKPDFSLRAVAELELTIRPESLPRLLKDEHLYPENLQGYYRTTAEALGSSLAELVAGTSPRPGALPDPAALRQALGAKYPDIVVLQVELRDLQRPDAELYALARESYRRLVAARDRSRDAEEAALAAERAREAAASERQDAALKSLAAYGELLDKYPILLKALYVQNLTGRELATVPGFDLDRVLSELAPPKQ